MATQEALRRAKSLLRSIRQQGEQIIFQDSTTVAEALNTTVALLRDMELSLRQGTHGIDPSSSDWKVIKALLELLTRLGILPFLSPGVGIKRSNSSSLLAAASAISCHLQELSKEKSVLQIYEDGHDGIGHVNSGEAILSASVEAMASFMWKRSISGAVVVGEDVDSLGMLTDAKESEIQLELVSSPISEMIVNHFLPDTMAGLLQLGYEPHPRSEGKKQDRYHSVAISRLEQMVKDIHVGKMIEASFALLNQSSPSPPAWLKGEVGKLLSKLIMRNGGLVAILQQLVGQVSKGNVEIYDKVSTHLAKVPKSVATVDEYFKAISLQLLPLLLCRSNSLGVGEASVTVLTNIYYTAILLACKLFTTDTVLAKHHILEPIMKPLLSWSSSQNASDVETMNVTEIELVNSIVHLQVLLTAGCRGSSLVRKTILIATTCIAPLLLKLHFQLEASDLNSSLASSSKKRSKEFAKNPKNIMRNGLAKGFLENGLDSSDVIDESLKHQSTLSRLKLNLADVVMAAINQDVKMALPLISSLLLESSPSVVKWPNKQGEVSAALHSTIHLKNPAMYVSRLLHAVENWPLLIAVMRELLHKILELRTLLADGSHIGKEMLRYMQDFEVLSSEGGSEALEHNVNEAAMLVKDLIEDENFAGDECMLEIVFHMVNNVLKGYRSSRNCTDHVSQAMNTSALVLNDITAALERLYGNPCLSEKLRQMSFTLAKETSFVCKNF